VKGHSPDSMNQLVDELAVAAARRYRTDDTFHAPSTTPEVDEVT
jgi:ribonuclease HI